MSNHGRTFLDIERTLDDAFEKLIYRRWSIPGPSGWIPRVDLHETADAFIVEVDLPGIPPECVEIRAAERGLTITGTRPLSEYAGLLLSHRERESGAFRRALVLPRAIAPERARAEYHHGTFLIRLLKKAPADPEHASAPPLNQPECLIRITLP